MSGLTTAMVEDADDRHPAPTRDQKSQRIDEAGEEPNDATSTGTEIVHDQSEAGLWVYYSLKLIIPLEDDREEGTSGSGLNWGGFGHNRWDMPVPPSLADRPGALLVIAARTGQELAKRRLSPLGLSVQLCGVLNLLAEGPISQQALGEQLGIDRTTIVELIDQLEKQGVVERRRNPADRRAYALSLTTHGRSVQKRAARAFDAAAADFFGPLKPAEKQAMSDMLRRMIASADEMMRDGQKP